ncbi:MAG: hypothetical protein LBD72_00370 [Puniceicoccales bacterium]|jgi:hypothetical protein|nr:hypothetical protein [Puniceicoccales bacterium]
MSDTATLVANRFGINPAGLVRDSVKFDKSNPTHVGVISHNTGVVTFRDEFGLAALAQNLKFVFGIGVCLSRAFMLSSDILVILTRKFVSVG